MAFIHMMPEQTVQAAIDLKAKVLLPVHWGKFTLSLHPLERASTNGFKRSGIKVTTPMIGEFAALDESYPDKKWWQF